MGRRALLIAALLLAPLSLATVEACAVPCGRIYPIITMKIDDQATTWDLSSDAPLVLDAVLTYQFDIDQEGYTVAQPNQEIVIRFEYPRLPDWASVKVEPESIVVPVNDPTRVVPAADDPTSPQAQYVFTTPIQITLGLLGQAVLRDGYDFAKLLVFAKSSESGLYQAGYGIKEVRVVPEGAVHESDVAGLRDVFTASPLPALALSPDETSFAGTTFAFTPPSGATFWEPAEYVATVSPAPAGRMVFAIHDEAGALVAATQPVDASTGEARLTATLAHPGRHTATLTLLPEAGTMAPPLTLAVPFDAGALDAEGFEFPKTYTVLARENAPLPLGSADEPFTQFERDLPFFAFETAQSVSAMLTLVSGELPADLGRSLANVQFSLHDPEGRLLQQGSVDPTRPTWSIRVGSLPTDGWYVLRLRGVGTPAGGEYEAKVEVNYAQPPQARNLADGVPDVTGGLLGSAGANLTLPADTLAVWTPSDATPVLDTGAAMRYSLTIHDANGTLAYASGIREGAASFSAPAPGTYRAFVYAEPLAGGTPFSPLVRAFTFDVGRGTTTVATTFAVDDGFEAPVGAMPTLLGFHAVPVLQGAGAPTYEGGELVDAEGDAAEGAAPGTYYLRVSGQGQPHSGSEVPARVEVAYASAVQLVGPAGPGAPPTGGLPVPGVAIALTLVAIGALAVGLALARR